MQGPNFSFIEYRGGKRQFNQTSGGKLEFLRLHGPADQGRNISKFWTFICRQRVTISIHDYMYILITIPLFRRTSIRGFYRSIIQREKNEHLLQKTYCQRFFRYLKLLFIYFYFQWISLIYLLFFLRWLNSLCVDFDTALNSISILFLINIIGDVKIMLFDYRGTSGE